MRYANFDLGINDITKTKTKSKEIQAPPQNKMTMRKIINQHLPKSNMHLPKGNIACSPPMRLNLPSPAKMKDASGKSIV